MKESTLSRRLSEFLGVALFAVALIWLISLVSHEPTDPVWFFTTDTTHAPDRINRNRCGRGHRHGLRCDGRRIARA